MSKYTTEVRFICENFAGEDESTGYENISQTIQKALPKIFDFDFPIYDEAYRNVLETKIINHYYTREIGLETVGLWKHFLQMKLTEIMPYYNQLYQSTLLDFNPLYDVDLNTTSNRAIGQNESNTAHSEGSASGEDHGTGSSNSTTDSNGSSTNRYSDTPQGGLDGIENNTYLTNATLNNDTEHTNTQSSSKSDNSSSSTSMSDGTGSRKYNSTDEYLEHVIGKSAGVSYSSRLKEFRETFLNIDMLIIDELGDLFMKLW